MILGAGIALVATTPAAASPSDADTDAALAALPTPNAFVSGLDLECFRTQGPALNIQVQLSHLNPVLQQLGLPAHPVVIRELVQTCVPVMKNNVPPQDIALQFIRHVDLACYRIEAPQLAPVTINLRHLNPVLANLPGHAVTMLQPQQLCVPVGKNGVVPPQEVLDVVRFIDLECYATQTGNHPVFGVNLTQLNPQLANIPPHGMTLVPAPRQMCVPMRKNNQAIPAASLNIVRWVDLEKFASSQPIGLPPINVVLDHLNPLFATLPRVPVVLQVAEALMVPVSKNGVTPP